MILLSGSLAFDYIMNFPGYFEDHILAEKIHVLNVSFLVDSLDRKRGGVAGNVAYSLGLLQQPCRIMATVGDDFDDYRSTLEGLGVDTSGIKAYSTEVTASAFITTDRADNQITGFFPGAMSHAGQLSILDSADDIEIAVISPTAPDAMERHVTELREHEIPYLYDPGQQIIALSPGALRSGIEGAQILASNDYELAMIEEKTGLSRQKIIDTVPIVVVTLGELGSMIYTDDEVYQIPSAPARSVVDPTGAGDGYRAGLLAGWRRGLTWDQTGRVAALAATYVVENKGTQEHRYSVGEFAQRLSSTFPELADITDALFEPARDTRP